MTNISSPIRAAIIGTGRIADTIDDELIHYPGLELPKGNVHSGGSTVLPKSHAGGYQQVDGFELVAGANRGVERLREFGRRREVDMLFEDYQHLLEEANPDVVSVCTQSPEKCEVTVACAEAGVRAVIVEKAMGTSLTEVDRMIEACKSSGTLLAVNHPFRFSPVFRQAREIIDDQEIGELQHISSHTGTLVHGGSHDFDLARLLAGDVRTVRARVPELKADHRTSGPLNGTYPDYRGDVMLTFRNGATGYISGTTSADMGMTVRGANGYLNIPRSRGIMRITESQRGDPAEFGYEKSVDRGVAWQTERGVWGHDQPERSTTVVMLEELRQALIDGDQFNSTGVDGRAALELGIAAYHSALTSSPVQLPLERSELRVLNK